MIDVDFATCVGLIVTWIRASNGSDVINWYRGGSWLANVPLSTNITKDPVIIDRVRGHYEVLVELAIQYLLRRDMCWGECQTRRGWAVIDKQRVVAYAQQGAQGTAAT